MTHERAVSESLLLLLLLHFFCVVFCVVFLLVSTMDFQFPGILSLHNPLGKYQQNPVGPGQRLVGGAKQGAASLFLVPQVEQKISARVVRTTSAAAAVSEAPPPPRLSHPSLMVSCHLTLAPRTNVSRKPEQLLGSGRRSQ